MWDMLFTALVVLRNVVGCYLGVLSFINMHHFSPWHSLSKLNSAHLAYRNGATHCCCVDRLWAFPSMTDGVLCFCHGGKRCVMADCMGSVSCRAYNRRTDIK